VKSRVVLACALSLCCGSSSALRAQTANPHLRTGEVHAAAGRWAEAERSLQLALASNPGSVRAAVLHAESLAELGQPFDAVLELEKLLGAKPNEVSALKLYASLMEQAVQNSAAAEEALRKCTRAAPTDADGWMRLGLLYLKQTRASDALPCFEKAARLRPSDPLAQAAAGRALGLLSRDQEAAAAFKRATALNARLKRPQPGVDLAYAEHLASLNEHAQAVEFYTRVLEAAPRLVTALYGRASSWEKLGELRKAEADARAAAMEPGMRRASALLLQRIYRQLNEPGKAAEQAETVQRLEEETQALRSTERSVRAALNSAEKLFVEGRYAEAIEPYQSLVKLLPTFYEAWFALGACYHHTGRKPEAEAAFREYLKLQPLSGDGHAALGMLLLEQGRILEAKTELAEAVRLNPEQTEARTALAQIGSQPR